MIINDFPLDHPDYSLCEWYDPDFRKRKHKSTIPGTTVEFTSHSFRFEEQIFFGAPSVVFDLFRAVGQDQGVRNLWMDRPANAKEAPTVPAWRGFGWYTDQSPKGNVEVPEFIFRPENYESWIMAQKIEKREYWAELAASTGIEVVKEEHVNVEVEMMDVEDGIYDVEMVDAEDVEVDDDELGFLCSQLKSLNLSGPSSTS
ncbi:hypothetical protein BDN72DRAFT_894617 [Pluteus cervinus]|uniref:Uncharacterized protein n=1 Tax=Pluteus cervinus TaxID=181527 RepID=A0ACD3B4A2_9AGAR|nr:hypothetical protein BDN72DRAFT_894617 [Pluteus cervinus]